MSTATPTRTPTRTVTATATPTHGFAVVSFGQLAGNPGGITSFEVFLGAGGIVAATFDFCFPEDVFTISADAFDPNPNCQSFAGTVSMEFCDGVTGSACDPACPLLPFGRRVRVVVTGISASSGETLLDCGSLPVNICADDSPNTVPCPPLSTAVFCYPVGVEAKLINEQKETVDETGQIVLEMFPFEGGPGDFCEDDCRCLSGSCVDQLCE